MKISIKKTEAQTKPFILGKTLIFVPTVNRWVGSEYVTETADSYEIETADLPEWAQAEAKA